jgi:hypothetical protein
MVSLIEFMDLSKEIERFVSHEFCYVVGLRYMPKSPDRDFAITHRDSTAQNACLYRIPSPVQLSPVSHRGHSSVPTTLSQFANWFFFPSCARTDGSGKFQN